MTRAIKTAAEYLDLMTGFAEMLRTRVREGHIDLASLAAHKRYVRINGGGLRVVSLCPDSPCGKVDGQNTRKTARALSSEIADTQIPSGEPKAKPEHRWQAALIEHALRWPEALPDVLKLRDACDELRLVTDELSVPVTDAHRRSTTIRADVVLLGRKEKTWFPVYIELKVKRSLDRLLKQLQNIEAVGSLDEPTRDAFKRFLATGVPSGEGNPTVDLDRALKVIIWPSTVGKSTRIQDALQMGVRVLEFPSGSLPAAEFAAPGLPLMTAKAAYK